MILGDWLSERRAQVDAALERLLPPAGEPPGRLHESLRYSVLAPGKRFRPILVIAAAEALGADGGLVMPTACALECIHVFSLIHDDLPCMDDDDLRRGRPTNHRVYGEALALLAGDALLALAFQLIAENGRTAGADRVLPVLELVARASGTRGMVGGQVADMDAEGAAVTPDGLRYIHAHKTGALITAAVLAGAHLAGASDAQAAALDAYGAALGLAFQIADDILDITGDEALIGKPVGSDVGHDKATYPRLYGIDASRARAAEQADAAVAALDGFGAGADPLRLLARYVVERDL